MDMIDTDLLVNTHTDSGVVHGAAEEFDICLV